MVLHRASSGSQAIPYGRESTAQSRQPQLQVPFLCVYPKTAEQCSPLFQAVLRGLNSCQNGILVLFLPTLELGKISTLVNGNISNIGSRLWENIDFLYTAVKEKGTLTKEHPQPLTLI